MIRVTEEIDLVYIERYPKYTACTKTTNIVFQWIL